MYRKGGSLHSTYLGKPDSKKFKRYLLTLISKPVLKPNKRAQRLNFAVGAPVVTVENGYLVYSYKGGSKVYKNSKLKVIKTVNEKKK